MDIAGNPIGTPTGFFIGVGANPGAVNLDEEIKRLDCNAIGSVCSDIFGDHDKFKQGTFVRFGFTEHPEGESLRDRFYKRGNSQSRQTLR